MIVNEYKHDTNCYSQGIFYLNGFFYESCGHYGQSNVRKVEIKTGRVL